MDRVVKKTSQFPNRLYQYRWQVISIICLIILSFEIIEHTLEATGNVVPFVFELLAFATLLLVLGLLIGRLIRNYSVEMRITQLLDQKHQLSVQMTKAQDWQDVLEIVYQIPVTIGINADAHLLINDEHIAEFGFVPSSAASQEPGKNLEILIPEEFIKHCGACTNSELHSFQDCQANGGQAGSPPLNAYCLPLFYENSRFALMQLYPTADKQLTDAQFNSLNNLGPDIAIALGSAMQRKVFSDMRIANSATAARAEISRDLHDTLGQNLSYLHLKLDQFTRDNPPNELTEIHSDLIQMREITRESNELLRGTLISLHPETQSRLTALLKQHGQQMSERAKFKFQFESQGTPYPLTAATLRQIFYIYREALNNVEQHAHATAVCVRLTWTKGMMELKIEDDGCGFELAGVDTDKHLGLGIMQERIETLGGEILFDSTKGEGTCITIRLPLLS